MSLSSRIAVVALLGLGIFLTALAAGIRWAAGSIADDHTEAYLAAYADVLVTAIRIEGGIPRVPENRSVVFEIPRDWQIEHGKHKGQRSRNLASAFPVFPEAQEGVRFLFSDPKGRQIDAYQRSYRFSGNRWVAVTFGIDASEAAAYAAEQRAALRDKLNPVVFIAGVLGVLILASQIAAVILPLRRLREDLAELKQGRKKRLDDQYPSELHSLTREINGQLERSEASLKRYRLLASNLAHAIKTPLTALRIEAESGGTASHLEAIDAIDAIVERNLARARISSSDSRPATFAEVEPLLAALSRTYQKLSMKAIHLSVADRLFFKGDVQDFVEAIGNIIENACKHATSSVRVSAEVGQIIVSDDGPGIASDERRMVLKRGARLDESGSGIGLSIAAEIADSYGGSIELDESGAGGLEVTIRMSALVANPTQAPARSG